MPQDVDHLLYDHFQMCEKTYPETHQPAVVLALFCTEKAVKLLPRYIGLMDDIERNALFSNLNKYLDSITMIGLTNFLQGFWKRLNQPVMKLIQYIWNKYPMADIQDFANAIYIRALVSDQVDNDDPVKFIHCGYELGLHWTSQVIKLKAYNGNDSFSYECYQ